MTRFNARAYWEALSPLQQRAIGEAALLVGLTIPLTSDETRPPLTAVLESRWKHAARMGWRRLQSIIPAGIARYPEGPDLAALGIRACRVCGCTEASACPEGCRWVAEDLCSACVPDNANGGANGGANGAERAG